MMVKRGVTEVIFETQRKLKRSFFEDFRGVNFET